MLLCITAAHGRPLRDIIKKLAKVAWEKKEADERFFAHDLRTRLVCAQYKLSAEVALRRAKAIEANYGNGVAADGRCFDNEAAEHPLTAEA